MTQALLLPQAHLTASTGDNKPKPTSRRPVSRCGQFNGCRVTVKFNQSSKPRFDHATRSTNLPHALTPSWAPTLLGIDNLSSPQPRSWCACIYTPGICQAGPTQHSGLPAVGQMTATTAAEAVAVVVEMARGALVARTAGLCSDGRAGRSASQLTPSLCQRSPSNRSVNRQDYMSTALWNIRLPIDASDECRAII